MRGRKKDRESKRKRKGERRERETERHWGSCGVEEMSWWRGRKSFYWKQIDQRALILVVWVETQG